MEGNSKDDLKEPFLEEGEDNLKSMSEVALEGPNPTVEAVFKKVGKIGANLKDGLTAKEHVTLSTFSKNGNLFYNIKEEGKLELYSLSAQKQVYTEQVDGITVLYITPQNSKYFVGYSNGCLEARNPTTMEVLGSLQLGSQIMAVISDDKMVYVSLNDGRIVFYNINNMTMDSVKEIQEANERQYMSVLKLSRDKTFLVGYVDIDNLESFYVYNIIKNQRIWEGTLDLAGYEIREDPDKLITISEDNLNVYARSANSKGVTMYSLFDGSVVVDNPTMHTNYLYQFIVTKDGKTVISCGKDKRIKVWDWIKQKLVSTLVFHEDTVESIALSMNENILFSGGLDGKIGVWAVKEQLLITHLITDYPIRTLVLSDDNDYLLAVQKFEKGKKKEVKFWALEKNEDAFRINVDLKGVNSCYVTPNNMYMGLQNKTQLDIWNIQSRTLVQNYEISANFWLGIRTLNGTNDSQYIMFQQESGEVHQWECASQSIIHTYSHNDLLLDLVISNDEHHTMYCSSEKHVFVWDIPNKSEKYRIPHPEANYIYLVLSADNKKLMSNAYGPYVFVIDCTQGPEQKISKFDIIKDSGWVLFELSLDGNILIQTSQYNGSFWVVDLKEEKVLKILNKNRRVIEQIAFTKDGKACMTRSPSETVIWDVKTWDEIITIEEDFGIVTSTNRYCNALIQDNLYKLWSNKVLSDFSDDYVVEEEEVKTEDRDAKKELKLTGPFNQIAPLFVDSMLQKSRQDQIHYVELLKKNAILPFKFNIVHYFAYTNNSNSLGSALTGGAAYQADHQGKLPLEYAIARKSYTCSATQLDYIMNSNANIYNKMKESEIIDIIDFSPSNLKDFFDQALIVQEAGLPGYGIIKKEPITYLESEGSLLTSLDAKQLLKNTDEDAEDALPLVFKGIQFQYNFEEGSNASIRFLEVLQSANLETFRSASIQAILNYKWGKVKHQAYFLAFMYVCYVITLFCNIEYGETGGLSTVVLMGFAVYFLLFELYQMTIRTLDYFTDFWNLFDLCRGLLLIYYAGADWVIGHNEELEAGDVMIYVLASLNLLSWFRAISYLRLFQETRVLISLIVQVIRDMVAFMIVLLAALLGFTTTFSALGESETVTMIGSLKHNYRLMFGDFNPDDYTTAGWILFIIGSVFMTLVMLNMLIAIMSDTYARVMGEIVPSDYQELNNMILEQEEIMTWKRNSGKPVFLHWVQYLEKSEEDEWEGQIQQLIKKVGQSGANDPAIVNGLNTKMDAILEILTLGQRDSNLKFDEQKKRFDSISQIIQQRNVDKLLGK